MSSNFEKRFFETQKENVMKIVSDKTCWVFVTYDVSDLTRPARLKDAIEIVWQLEKGEKKKRLHLQGYVRFRYPKSRAQLQELMPAWWHIRHGSHEQAIAYSSKTDTRVTGPFRFRCAEGFTPYEAPLAEANAIALYKKKQ